LIVQGLRVDVEATGQDVVDEVSFAVPAGRVLGLVGESGSGKTTVGLAVLGHARRGVCIVGGTVRCGTTDVLALGEPDRRALRGGRVSYVPQDPASALNPALRIGVQLREVLEAHDFGKSAAAREVRLAEMMAEVLLPGDADYLARYPHQLSGGQQQRVGLAMAFACRPSVLVLDEPTTGLDVTTQAHVLETVRDLTRRHGVAALYITHDLAVVADLADEVAVMYAGRVVEHGSVRDIFVASAHPYTRHLVAAAPDIAGREGLVGLVGRAPAPGRRPTGCAFAPRCSLATDACRDGFPAVTRTGAGHDVRCVHARPGALSRPALGSATGRSADAESALSVEGLSASYTGVPVVHDVSFELLRGECLAVVGESGSGKTTVSRCIGGLHKEWVGSVKLGWAVLARDARARALQQRLGIQYVFQNPYGSLNPRRTVGATVRRPLVLAGVDDSTADRIVAETLERVALTASYANRYPDQLSGGERQRVAIARALAHRPDVLVCDEITSALDVVVQAAIVELLAALRRDLGLSMLFITHNLPLVRSIADSVVVMSEGRIVERGPAARVIDDPREEYTRRLISDTPSIVRALA
jgi:peptide/nickel transport system ATP-binding protein